MSINNFTNFNLPSLNGLIDIHADTINSLSIQISDISCNSIETIPLFVDGVE